MHWYKFTSKIPVVESYYSKDGGLKPVTLLQLSSDHRCFPVKQQFYKTLWTAENTQWEYSEN